MGAEDIATRRMRYSASSAAAALENSMLNI